MTPLSIRYLNWFFFLITVSLTEFFFFDDEPVVDYSDWNLLHVILLAFSAMSVVYANTKESRLGNFRSSDYVLLNVTPILGLLIEFYFRVVVFFFFLHSLEPLGFNHFDPTYNVEFFNHSYCYRSLLTTLILVFFFLLVRIQSNPKGNQLPLSLFFITYNFYFLLEVYSFLQNGYSFYYTEDESFSSLGKCIKPLHFTTNMVGDVLDWGTNQHLKSSTRFTHLNLFFLNLFFLNLFFLNLFFLNSLLTKNVDSTYQTNLKHILGYFFYNTLTYYIVQAYTIFDFCKTILHNTLELVFLWPSRQPQTTNDLGRHNHTFLIRLRYPVHNTTIKMFGRFST